MRCLVTDVLDLARLEAGPTLSNELVYLEEVAKAVHKELSPLAEAKEQVLRLNLPKGLLPVSGDRQLLHRACANLVHNAIKYTPHQGMVEIAATQDKGMATVSVADNGRGIPVELQSRLFEPFFRGTLSTTQAEGTGLGLSIVKTIVEKHRGKIGVDSYPGAGSTFSFRIPVAADDSVR